MWENILVRMLKHFDKRRQRETSSKNKICEAEEDENDKNVHLSHRQKQNPEQVNRRSSISFPSSIMSGLIWTEFHLTSIWSEHNRSDRFSHLSPPSPPPPLSAGRSPTCARDREDEEESARALGDYRVSQVKEERPEGLTCENYKKKMNHKNTALITSR